MTLWIDCKVNGAVPLKIYWTQVNMIHMHMYMYMQVYLHVHVHNDTCTCMTEFLFSGHGNPLYWPISYTAVSRAIKSHIMLSKAKKFHLCTIPWLPAWSTCTLLPQVMYMYKVESLTNYWVSHPVWIKIT